MQSFRAAVEAGDHEAVVALLHPDCVFNSPAVFRPYEGRDATAFILMNVVQIFEDFRYIDELEGEDSHGLVFKARVGDKDITGWDYLKTDEDGLITEFTVMIRPLSGLQALVEEMGARMRV